MGKNDRTTAPPQKAAAVEKPKKPIPPADTDDDYEDGDMATPKPDGYGTDDEPL